MDLDYLEGLASFNVVFTKVFPDTKHTTRTWDYFENLHESLGESRLDYVDTWLRQGYGVGYLLRGGLAAVDADGPETVQRILDFEDREVYIHLPKVQTPSGGVHAHFRHPSDIDMTRLKNHVCHPYEDDEKVPWDFKLNSRTMLMAPGTIMSKGSYRAGIWLPPPTFDVRFLAPELEIYRDIRPFLRNTRSLEDRMMGAMGYLEHRAPIAIKGLGRRAVLRRVAEHVVGWYDLDPHLALYFMTTTTAGSNEIGESIMHIAWNARCLDSDGKKLPWTRKELLDALYDALDAAPAYGILMYEKAQAKAQARQKAAEFIEVLTYLPEPHGVITIASEPLHSLFLEFSGVQADAYHKSELGMELNIAMAEGRLPFVKQERTSRSRFYVGMDERTIRYAIGVFEQRRKGVALAS
ncbi:bifunctional DNA primase/polymerase [Mesoterricola sediminis]|nr:bifunctional DNA primase/polymerase [Mesoterricola sediminis]